MQTCRRHPSAGRFMATCSGCTQELHDMQARNEAMTAARAAIAKLGPKPLTIQDAKRVDRQGVTHLIVASRSDSSDFGFCVDVFREPTRAEMNPELEDPIPAGSWVLVDQWGAHSEAEHREHVAAARAEYGPRIVLT
jgi:peroxiredoxin